MKKNKNVKPYTPAKNEPKAIGSKSTSRALLYTLGLIASAIAILLLSSFILPRLQFIENMREGSFPPFPHLPEPTLGMELGSFLLLRLLLSGINIVLLIYLVYIYVQDYLQLRTSFSLGIVAFLFSFLLYALASFPPLHYLLGPRGIPDVFAFIPMIFSAIGLLIFAKLSNE